jgi:CheY-like chemotaxis protein
MTSRTHSILVVDDDSMVLSLYVDALAVAGHRVEVANNGDAALRRLQTGPVPCVVLTDVRMPVMDGFELSSALAADPQLASIPVVMMTGDRILSFTTPARDKPFDPAELDALVQRSCVLHRRQEGAA